MPHPLITHPQPHRFTIADYYAMGDHAILAGGNRDELIEGEVIDMPAMGGRHAACVARLNDLLTRALLDSDAMVRPQLPIRQEPNSEPLPDLAVVRRHAGYYVDGHPTPTDVLLLIEVADSSLAFDRDRKLPLYRSWGIPETWIVNLPLQVIHVARGPLGEELTYQPGDRITAQLLPMIDLAVNDILP